MDQKTHPERGVTPQPTEADRRRERLAAALRDNLKKRKAQMRARSAHDPHSSAPLPQDAQKPTDET